ncbi:MAG: class I SAM-dependent methyltransferase [Acetobacteraceae bacterium]
MLATLYLRRVRAKNVIERHHECICSSGSALDLPFGTDSFDLILCQLGVQFFPDQKQALREIRRVLFPSGRARFHRSWSTMPARTW